MALYTDQQQDGIVKIKGHQPNATPASSSDKAKGCIYRVQGELGKGYRPVAAASCVLGHQMMREDHLASPLEVKHKCGSPCPGRPSLPSRWNGTGPESKQDLSPSLPQAQTELVCVMGFSVVLFVCLFGLEPMDTQHGVESREGEKMEEWRTQRRGGDEVWGWGVLASWWGRVTHRPPLEVTSDLPRSYRVKLLNKYTQTSGSGQQRRIAASDPSTDVFFWPW